jgi:hydrogenase-4 membrane subunit HyfE
MTGLNNLTNALNLRKDANKSLTSNGYTESEQIKNFFSIFFKVCITFFILTCNFLGMSVALNVNKGSSISMKFFALLYGFFFGFMYLILNYYTYRVITLRRVVIMDKKTLFPL